MSHRGQVMTPAQARRLDQIIARVESLERDLIATGRGDERTMARLKTARTELLSAWNERAKD